MSDAILITGCSTGLGLETALHLAECGFTVYATVRDIAQRPVVRHTANQHPCRSLTSASVEAELCRQ